MSFSIRLYTPRDRAALHALLRHPSLEGEFGWLLDNGELHDPLRHPYGDPAGVWVGEVEGALAGFAMMLRLASKRGDWTAVRVGVRAPFRRRGLGRALVEQVLGRLRATGVAATATVCVSHWLPGETAPPFARHLDFEHDRYFWTMERMTRTPPPIRWPAGIETAPFDFSDRGFQDWNDSYNVAFADNALSPTSTVEACRRLAETAPFDPSGMVLAYRSGRCVGFCRNALLPGYGDVDVLGVVPEARGIGLGRALLRWGVAWLLSRQAPRVQLTVDGENQAALALYRSEGFTVARTRQIWRRLLGA